METFKNIGIPILSIIVSVIIAYYTANRVYKKQFEDGKIQILEILKRYIINVKNNITNGSNAIVKTSALDKEFYLTELKSIYSDFKLMLGNPVMIKVLKKHTGLTMLIIALRREIVYLEQPNSTSSIYSDTLKHFLDLFFLMKKEFKQDWFENDKNLKEINEIAEYLKRHV